MILVNEARFLPSCERAYYQSIISFYMLLCSVSFGKWIYETVTTSLCKSDKPILIVWVFWKDLEEHVSKRSMDQINAWFF